MSLKTAPTARANMLIRRPAKEVFNAFVDPAITTKFWFSRSSGKLEEGKSVKWYWDMYGVSAEVAVRAIEQDRRILIEWPTPVEWLFTPRGNNTFVSITASDFTGSQDEQVSSSNRLNGWLLLCSCWPQSIS